MSFFRFCYENVKQSTYVGGVIVLGLIVAAVIAVTVVGLLALGPR